VGSAGGQHTELVAVGIRQLHPADTAATGVEASRSEGDQTIDLGMLIAVQRWSEVEVQAVPSRLVLERRAAPGDLRTAVR